MKLFTNASHEHLVGIIEDFIDQTFEKYDGSIGDVVSDFYAVGFTRQEILDILNRRYLDKYEWEEEEETVPAEDVNPEEVDIGDSDQAILETALVQIGIPYTFEDKANYRSIFIDEVENGKTTNRTAVEVYFTKDGKFNGLC